jgi:hypothetical protein
MELSIRSIADQLNKLAAKHPCGELQRIRAMMKNKSPQIGSEIFRGQSISEEWAFHWGERTELQFNIGFEDRKDGDCFRFGVAFSFQTSRSMKSIDVLVPKVKLFNDFLTLNGGDFSDMRMWHDWCDEGEFRRSEDRPPGPIPTALVREGVFVFMGNRLRPTNIDYECVLDVFDSLLPLYSYVESGRSTSPVPLPTAEFRFEPGQPTKVIAATVSHTERELDVELRHNILQHQLYRQLVAKHGKENVRSEQPSGVGTRIDTVLRNNEEYWFYEIKTALTPRACLREAIGQILEYGFWPGAQEPARLIVIGETPIDDEAREYLLRLEDRFSLRIEYQSIKF